VPIVDCSLTGAIAAGRRGQAASSIVSLTAINRKKPPVYTGGFNTLL
jgi:hypothetical protein